MPLPVFASARYLSKPQPLYTAVRLLLRDVSRRVLSRNAAKDYDIGHGVAAQAVLSVDTAGALARGVQAGNGGWL